MSATSPNTVSGESPRVLSRELVMLLCVLALLLLLALTALLSRLYHRKIHSLADAMFAQGEADEQAGQIKAALTDYRNALAYNPSNPLFQFHLAKALAAAGRGEEARSYLLNLLSESPGSGEVNLELARIAKNNNSMADAMRYYQGAIYGEWADDPIAMRWQVRRELCEFLLSRGAVKQAAPEVIALEENIPAGDLARLKIVGQLLLRTQQWARALDVYHTLLAADPNDEEPLAGDGIFRPAAVRKAATARTCDSVRHGEANIRGGSISGGAFHRGAGTASGERIGVGTNTHGSLRAANGRIAGTDYAANRLAAAVRAGQDLAERLDAAIPGAVSGSLGCRDGIRIQRGKCGRGCVWGTAG